MNVPVGVLTTTTTPTTTCPAWCVSDHQEDTNLHYQADTHIPVLYADPFAVSAFVNASRGQAGVYVGSAQLAPVYARQLAARLLECATLAEAAAMTMDEADR
jgi:hypothetical protein